MADASMFGVFIERNFHIFCQLTEACTESQRNQLGLGRAQDYNYLAMSNCVEVDGIDDTQDFADMLAAMSAIGFSDDVRPSNAAELMDGLTIIVFIEDYNSDQYLLCCRLSAAS